MAAVDDRLQDAAAARAGAGGGVHVRDPGRARAGRVASGAPAARGVGLAGRGRAEAGGAAVVQGMGGVCADAVDGAVWGGGG